MENGEVTEYSFRIENAVVKIVIDGIKKAQSKYSEMSLHTHSFAEIFICEKDTFFLKTDDGLLSFKEGECAVIPMDCRHKVIMNNGVQSHRAIGILCEKIGKESKVYSKLAHLIDTSTPYVIKGDDALCKAVRNITETTDEWTIFCNTLSIVRSFCLADTPEHIKDLKRVSAISKNVDRLVELERIIFERFVTNLSYADIANELHISQRQLIRIIKKHYNGSLCELIRKQRMDVATKLLSESDLPIEKIATDIGYKSKAAFYNVFKKSYGITPAAYRKNHKI